MSVYIRADGIERIRQAALLVKSRDNDGEIQWVQIVQLWRRANSAADRLPPAA